MAAGKQQVRLGISALAMLVALCPAAALADPVTIRAGERGQGARLVLDWPAPVTHNAQLDGNQVRLSFARPVQAQVSAITSRLPGWVSAAALSDDGRILTLTLKRSVTVQSFTSGNRVVVDLAPVSASPTPAPAPTQAAPAKPAPTPTAKPAAPAPRPPTSPAAKPVEAPKPPLPPSAPLAPVANSEGEATAATPRVELPETPAAPEAPPPVASPAADPAPPPATQSPPAPAAPEDETKPADQGTLTVPPASQAVADDAPPPRAAPPVRSVSASPLPLFTIPPLEMTVVAGAPIAAFQRGSSFFVVVNDKDTPRELIPLVGQALANTERVQLIPAQGGRVIHIDLRKDSIEPVIEVTDKGWRLRFDAPSPMVREALELAEEPDYALGPRVLLKSDAAANPVTFVDPVRGDTLTAVPTGKLGAAVLKPARFVQAELLPTVQGVAVRPWADDLNVISSALGVEISATSGFKLSERLSSEQPTATAQVQMQAPPVPTLPPLFDFETMGAPAGADFTAQREALQNAIIAAPEEKKGDARLELARFYFINGMPTEAAVLWQMVAKENSEIANRPDYPLIRAIAAFSSGTTEEIKSALAAVGQPTMDLALWRGLLAVRERDWVTASEQFRTSLKRMWDYPEPYLSRLVIGAIETALNTQDYALAETLLDKLVGQQRLARGAQNPAVEYFTGVLAWSKENADEAKARLGNAATSWNNFWRVRAELALIEAEARDVASNPHDLIRRLERLSFAWRGDALEFDILHQLAQLRLQVADFAGAFNNFAQLTSKFPADPRTPGLAEQQRAAFVRIFQSEDRDRTPAHVQLAIWNGYPQFRPAQPAVLDEVRGYLAERVAAIDLLPEATGFYNEVLAGVTDPLRRAELGTRIAGLSLLDKKPEAALKALVDTEPASGADRPRLLGDELRDERRILRARAVFATGKPDEALSMLINDYSEPAMRLRADITWQTKRWAEAAAVLDALIGPVPPDGKLAADKAGMVVSRATALALAGDRRGLNDMRVNYGAAMAQTPNAAAFQLVTRPDVAGGLPDRATLSGRMAEVDLFKQFLERYRQPSAAAVEPTPEAVAEAPARVVGPGATPQPAQTPTE